MKIRTFNLAFETLEEMLRAKAGDDMPPDAVIVRVVIPTTQAVIQVVVESDVFHNCRPYELPMETSL